jgi:hypothetical protein
MADTERLVDEIRFAAQGVNAVLAARGARDTRFTHERLRTDLTRLTALIEAYVLVAALWSPSGPVSRQAIVDAADRLGIDLNVLTERVEAST